MIANFGLRIEGMIAVPPAGIIWIVAGLLASVFIFSFLYAARYRKVGPNEVMIVSGGPGRRITGPDGKVRKVGFRWVKGGARYRAFLPVISAANRSSPSGR